VHPREHDLIVGSMGRGVFVTNINPLQELNHEVLAKDVHFFRIKPTVQRIIWNFGANDRLFSQRHIVIPNEPNGMVIQYYLKNERKDSATVVITDYCGTEVARLQGETATGINTIFWDMQEEDRRRRGRGRYSPDLWVPVGAYLVTLEVGGQKFIQPAHITKRQGWSVGTSFPNIFHKHP